MLLKTRGKSYQVDAPIVGKVTKDIYAREDNLILLAESDALHDMTGTFLALLTKKDFKDVAVKLPGAYSVHTLDHLYEGDIVVINSDGVVNTLYRVNSHHNSLLVTERCNSNCLMCSQPPRDRNDIPYLFALYKQLIPLIPKDCLELGITGGEPTLMGNLFYELLELIKFELPDTDVHCLTNGRTFAWYNTAKRLAEIDLKRLVLGIPVYADYYAIHDYIVQAKHAFNQTILGLYNLASFHQRIELRIVLHKQSIPRLTKLAHYIYKNLPFVEHVAFMGLENQGYTPYNIQKLWIDPIEYMDELSEAVDYLSSRDMNVSIYNSQLCLMPKGLWQYARKSISDWKNIYIEECNNCALIDDCGGFFASCKDMHSQHIKALKLESL